MHQLVDGDETPLNGLNANGRRRAPRATLRCGVEDGSGGTGQHKSATCHGEGIGPMGSGQARPSHSSAAPGCWDDDMHGVAGICGLETKAGRGGEPAEGCSGAREEKGGHLSLQSNRRSPIKLVDPWENDSPVSTQVPADGSLAYAAVPELGSGEQAELVTQQPSRRVVEIHTTSLPARSSAARASLRPVDGATNCRGGVDRPA